METHEKVRLNKNYLFPEYLKVLQEYKPNMPLIDMLNTLERIGVINSTEDWIDYRKLRNNLTHEYPGNEKEIIDSLNSALEAYGNIKNIYMNIVENSPLSRSKRELGGAAKNFPFSFLPRRLVSSLNSKPGGLA